MSAQGKMPAVNVDLGEVPSLHSQGKMSAASNRAGAQAKSEARQDTQDETESVEELGKKQNKVNYKAPGEQQENSKRKKAEAECREDQQDAGR